jgi:dipeptidyl aminopeptidase/acylaminoacyl peptidase
MAMAQYTGLGWAAVCVAVCLAPAGAAGAQTKRFTADDLPKIVRIGDPQVSPNGKTVAIVVSRANLKEDRYDTELALVDVASHQVRHMTHDRLGIASPRWSPSGDRLAFIAQDTGKKGQLFVLSISGGDAQQLTSSKTDIKLLAWRPDGQALAFAAPDEEVERQGEAKFEDAFEVGNNNYTEGGRQQPTHLWTLNLADRTVKRLTSGAWSLPQSLPPSGPPSQIVWTKDGAGVLFVKADSPITGDYATSRIARVDVASGKVTTAIAADSIQSEPQLSPDGARVAYGFPRDGKRQNESAVYVATLAGGPAMDAGYALDRGLSLVGWMPDSRALVVSGNEGTRSVMWLQPIGGQARKIAMGDLNPGSGSVGPDGGIAFTATDPTHLPELYYLPHDAAAPVQLTHLQTAADGVALGRQETVNWQSDAFAVNGVLTYPPGYTPGKKLPLVLYIHGGPSAASLQTFTPSSQILAAQGWLVFEPNYRGSNNAGNAFHLGVMHDAGAGPGRDIVVGVKAIQARGIVDEQKIAVSGWSYGGLMTSWLIGAYPEMWKTAIAGAPVTDLVDQYTLSDNNINRGTFYGPSPFVGDNLKAYAAQSPITYAWRAKAPTLIMSDVGDWRVTTTQAYKLYHALSDNHVPVTFIAYPVAGHSPADPIRARDVWRRWTAWMKAHLEDAPMSTEAAR